MSAVPVPRRVAAAEYLERERNAEFRSELVDGEIRAMAGATYRHTLIVSNLSGSLHAALRGSPCTHHVADLRVTVEAAGFHAYPDVVIACGRPRFLDGRRDALLNPVAIVEILSPSTESYDRGRKFARYRLLDSLAEYVLVAQDEPRVEVYSRRDDVWALTQELTRLDERLEIPSAGVSIPLSEIYLRVDFADEP